uniref:Uncharacterized protein n=1 Tax=Glossina brevipalpis TaxID=37001 RepID=A0A1A9WRZ8_9MUSC
MYYSESLISDRTVSALAGMLERNSRQSKRIIAGRLNKLILQSSVCRHLEMLGKNREEMLANYRIRDSLYGYVAMIYNVIVIAIIVIDTRFCIAHDLQYEKN